jgi:hypothetical protein
VYLFAAAAMLIVPLLIAVEDRTDSGSVRTAAGAFVTGLILCGLALLLVPVRVAHRRPVSRRSVLIPLIASGLLLGGLVLGGGFALAQVLAPFINGDHVIAESMSWIIVGSAVAVWLAWSIVFALMLRRGDPQGIGMQLHRLLIAGSVLELVVAVPSHIIVRSRGDCCGGIVTGVGICIGVVVAFVSFGPSVLLLYYRRCRQIQIPASRRIQNSIVPGDPADV